MNKKESKMYLADFIEPIKTVLPSLKERKQFLATRIAERLVDGVYSQQAMTEKLMQFSMMTLRAIDNDFYKIDLKEKRNAIRYAIKAEQERVRDHKKEIARLKRFLSTRAYKYEKGESCLEFLGYASLFILIVFCIACLLGVNFSSWESFQSSLYNLSSHGIENFFNALTDSRISW